MATSSERTFTLNPVMHRMLKSRGYGLKCPKCLKPIAEGAVVTRKVRYRKRGRNTVRYFHAECWEKMLI